MNATPEMREEEMRIVNEDGSKGRWEWRREWDIKDVVVEMSDYIL